MKQKMAGMKGKKVYKIYKKLFWKKEERNTNYEKKYVSIMKASIYCARPNITP